MKDEKKFQIVAHAVLILLSVSAILPMILMVVSSFTDNDLLIAQPDSGEQALDIADELIRSAAVDSQHAIAGTFPRVHFLSAVHRS